jgi:hypothetical protein
MNTDTTSGKVTPTTHAEDWRPPRDRSAQAPRTRYDWQKIEFGKWQRWVDLRDDKAITDEEAQEITARCRRAASMYGYRKRYRVQCAWEHDGRVLSLRFTKRDV